MGAVFKSVDYGADSMADKTTEIESCFNVLA